LSIGYPIDFRASVGNGTAYGRWALSPAVRGPQHVGVWRSR